VTKYLGSTENQMAKDITDSIRDGSAVLGNFTKVLCYLGSWEMKNTGFFMDSSVKRNRYEIVKENYLALNKLSIVA
jgi:hypothetical protein